MNYIHLEAFYTVVKCDGFTRAALHTRKSQSAFSTQVAHLERALGTKLYEIVAKRIRLTPSGRRLFDGIAPFFEGLVDLRRSIQSPEEGQLALASTQNNLLYRLRGPLVMLRQRYPRVRLRLITIDNHEAADVLRAGDADLAVVRMPLDVPANVEYVSLPTTAIVLIAPPGHPITRTRDVTPVDIAAYPLVAYHHNEWLRQHCNRVFQSFGVQPEVTVEAGTAEIVKAYVRAGFGLAIVASLDFIVQRDSTLAVIPVDRYFGRDLTTALLPRGRFRPPYLQYFLGLLVRDFPGGGASGAPVPLAPGAADVEGRPASPRGSRTIQRASGRRSSDGRRR